MRRPWTVGLVLAAGALAVAPSAAEATTATFTANGTFTVPAGVTSLSVNVLGAQGGAASVDDSFSEGGHGGEAAGTVPVTPGEQLTVLVGGKGANAAGLQGAQGGVNGGGQGGASTGGNPNATGGAGGGGRSEIDRGATRLVVASGGGGGSPGTDAIGGPGGGLNGDQGGIGGTQNGPGAGAGDPNDSSGGHIGVGAAGGAGGQGEFGGGGGGGGWFGGGGGAGGQNGTASGGGGGSGHLDGSVTGGALIGDVQSGDGVVSIIYQSPSSTALSSDPNPVAQNATVTFTAKVTGQAPTGLVTFALDGTFIPGCATVQLGGSGDTRTAACETPITVGVGTHIVTANYAGDGDNAPSEGQLTQVVTRPADATAAQSTSATTTTTTTVPAPVLAPPTPVEPSNAFAFARVRVSKRELRLTFDYPGAGTLDALVTTRLPGASAARLRPGPSRVSVGTLHDSASGAQTKSLRVPLTSRGRRIFARRGKLPIRLSLVFTPAGGQSARQAHKYTVRR